MKIRADKNKQFLRTSLKITLTSAFSIPLKKEINTCNKRLKGTDKATTCIIQAMSFLKKEEIAEDATIKKRRHNPPDNNAKKRREEIIFSFEICAVDE
jgi:hypothetical protein